MKKTYLIISFIILWGNFINAQVYTEKQTRHRFAQLTLGADYQTSIGGTTSYLDANGSLQSLALGNLQKPRFLIGGTHFWGHADFYIAIPLLFPSLQQDDQTSSYSSGVETVFKYYPWRIEWNKLRPYVGVGLTPFYYEQKNKAVEYGNGAELNHTAVPLYAGLTFNKKQHLVELGIMWNYKNKKAYHISRTQVVDITTPPIYASVSYRYMLDTTLGAEKDWESGQTEKITNQLAASKRLNSFHLGVGLSTAFWIKESSYNKSERPYVEKYTTSLMPEFSLGYYLHKPDLGFALAYRRYGTFTNTYGANQQLNRKSLVLEATQFLLDYHGFVPFIGPAISYEQLSFRERFERKTTHDISQNKFGYGITFGWDIRPNSTLSWILRTNLRWFPNLNLEVGNDKIISFDNIEFNFIQLIVYPGRM